MIKEHSGVPEAHPSPKDICKKIETEILPNSATEAAIVMTDLLYPWSENTLSTDTSGCFCPIKKATHQCNNFFLWWNLNTLFPDIIK